jgi:hypothetical protein
MLPLLATTSPGLKCVSTDNTDLTLGTVRHNHAGRARRESYPHELPLESASANRGSFPSAHPRKPVCLQWLRALHRGRARPLLSTHDFQPSGIPRRKRHSRDRHYAFCASRSLPPPTEHALAMARVQATADATQAQLATLIAAMKTQTRDRPNNSGTSYCWTHGHTTNSSHTSTLCQKQADGHEVTATKTNTMGGLAHVYGC